jgi:hypothetical protein
LDLRFLGLPGASVRFFGGPSPIEFTSFNGVLSVADYGWTDVSFFRISTDSQFDVIVDNIQFRTAAIPEPSALLLLGTGAFGLLVTRRFNFLSKNV